MSSVGYEYMSSSTDTQILTTYSSADIATIADLLETLSPRFSDLQLDPVFLDEIIASPYHDLIVTRIDGAVVGIATLSITMGVGAGKKAYLEDFVVSHMLRGRGIGSSLWQFISLWCKQRQVSLYFTSRPIPSRHEAHQFYLHHGALIRETDVFTYTPK